MNLWSKFQCWLFGHRRGKVSGVNYDVARNVTEKLLRCPRCGATWKRVGKAKA